MKYPKWQIGSDIGSNCCGQLILAPIEATTVAHEYVREGGTYKYVQKEVGFDTALESLYEFEATVDKILDADNNDHWEEEDYHPKCYAFMSLTLYRGQHMLGKEDLIDLLVTRGWKIMQEGENPKTGNIIVNMGKDV